MNRRLRSLMLPVALLALFGCGDDTVPPPADSGADSNVPDPDGGEPADAAPDAGPSGPIRSMLVIAENATASHVVFVATGICTSEAIGPCIVDRCPATGDPLPYVDLGTITVTGDVSSSVVVPDAMGDYSSATGAERLWADGPVRFEATGGEWPAFDETLQPPTGNATLTAPAGDPATVDRTSPLLVEYEADGPGSFLFAISEMPMVGSDTTVVRCTAPTGAGQLTVPVEALGALASGAATALHFLEERRVVTVAPGEEVRLLARTPAVTTQVELE